MKNWNDWTPKARAFWPLVLAAFAADCSTKQWAEASLPERVSVRVFGDVVRLTLAHNPGAAMGMSAGSYSRAVFSILAIVGIVVTVSMYLAAPPQARWRAAALALITGGAAGNLVSRFITPSGVTDFIDVGTRAWRFWTFNVADSCISLGAMILLWSMMKEHPSPAETA
jgi:signal peptidase II